MIEERLDQLELKFMEQDILLNELNKIVTDQQSTIDTLVKLLKEKNQTSSTENHDGRSLFDQLRDEKPPHY